MREVLATHALMHAQTAGGHCGVKSYSLRSIDEGRNGIMGRKLKS